MRKADLRKRILRIKETPTESVNREIERATDCNGEKQREADNRCKREVTDDKAEIERKRRIGKEKENSLSKECSKNNEKLIIVSKLHIFSILLCNLNFYFLLKISYKII